MGWDFDGYLYREVENPELLPTDVAEKCRPCRWRPALSPAAIASTGQIPQPHALMQQPRVVDVIAGCIDEFPRVDHVGLLQYHWQLQAGRGPEAALTDSARELAALYSTAVGVEKGVGEAPEAAQHLDG